MHVYPSNACFVPKETRTGGMGHHSNEVIGICEMLCRSYNPMPLPKKHMILTVELFSLKISFKILPIFIYNQY